MNNRNNIIRAIRDSWSIESSAHPESWSESNRAKGQCDVSSFVCWENLGGELVLGQVFVDDELIEHHYWNRIDGEHLDITCEQFTGGETIHEIDVLSSDVVRARQASIRPELAARIDVLRSGVAQHVAADNAGAGGSSEG